jgi:2-hydroxychromene-2-carboxylate isomerase
MIEAFVDCRSPYAYIALTRLQRLAVPMDIKSVDIFRVMTIVKNQPTPACAAKYRYAAMDAARSARLANVPFNPNYRLLDAISTGELAGNWLMRVGIAASQLWPAGDFSMAMFQAVWNGTDDLVTGEGRSRFLSERGLHSEDLWERADSEDVLATLTANDTQAIEAGVFGVPTFLLDGEMFFGNDRIDLLLRKLNIVESMRDE